jgi:hypothetical protein
MEKKGWLNASDALRDASFSVTAYWRSFSSGNRRTTMAHLITRDISTEFRAGKLIEPDRLNRRCCRNKRVGTDAS